MVSGPSDKSSTRKTSSMRRMFTFMSMLVFIIALGLAVALTVVVIKNNEDNKDTKNNDQDICLTEGCTRAAARVLSAVDTTVDPCDNFYDFACGNWVKHHIIPEDRSALDIFGVIRDNVQVITKYLLEDPVTSPNATAIQEAKNLYQSCINLEMIEKKGVAPALPLLNEFGGWPLLGNKSGGKWNESEFNLAKLVTSLRKYNNELIFVMGVGIDDKNSTQHIITFDAGDFGMPGRDYLLESQFEYLRAAYHTMAVKIALQFGADPDIAEKDLTDALKLEIDLARITMSNLDQRNTSATYNPMTLGEFAKMFPPPKTGMKFDWMDYVHRQFALTQENITIDETEPILVRDMGYYRQLFDILNKYTKRTIANYCVWRIMQHRASNLPQVFDDIISEYDKVAYGVTSERARWRSCVSYTILQIGAPVGKLFVQEAFDETAKDTALDMIHGIRDAFTDMLEEEAWMNTKTRTAALEKANAMREWIGYAEDILDDEVLNSIYEGVVYDPEEYFQNVLNNLQAWGVGSLPYLRREFGKNSWTDPPTTVNAQYSFLLNNIQFPAGIFQPPFYKKDQPRSMNYGGIGVIIGHEITHGFDDQGRLYDKDGNYRNWWDDSVVHNFLDKTQCIVNQYGNFEVPELGEKVNGKLTLGENIADNGGLKESFRAYRNWVATNGKEEPLLPGLNFTNNQLFFLNFAQNWCNKESKTSYLNSLRTDVHSPGTFRVIGTLQNSPDFAKTFSCPSGSRMNPINKCTLW